MLIDRHSSTLAVMPMVDPPAGACEGRWIR